MGRPSFLPQLLAASAVAGSLFLLPAGVAEAQGNDSQWRPGESLSSLIGGTLLGGAVGSVVASWLFLRFDLKFNNQISAVDDNINDLKENLDEKTHDLTDKIDNNLTELNQTLSKDFKELKVKGEDNINRLNSELQTKIDDNLVQLNQKFDKDFKELQVKAENNINQLKADLQTKIDNSDADLNGKINQVLKISNTFQSKFESKLNSEINILSKKLIHLVTNRRK